MTLPDKDSRSGFHADVVEISRCLARSPISQTCCGWHWLVRAALCCNGHAVVFTEHEPWMWTRPTWCISVISLIIFRRSLSRKNSPLIFPGQGSQLRDGKMGPSEQDPWRL